MIRGTMIRLGLAGLALILAARLSALISAQEEGPTLAHERNAKLGRGVNIIGYDPIWRDRSQARMKDEHFRLIKEAGFDHVRINLHPFRHMGPEPDYALSDEWCATLDWAVERALASDLMVILDLHEFGSMGQRPDENKPRLLAAWRQLAHRYKDAPDTVLFELLNEPSRELTPEMWNDYLAELLAIVRESNPDRTVIIGPGRFNGIEALPLLALPEDDRNIIVTVHFYEPFRFTHQGAGWAGEDIRKLSGIEWTGTQEERDFIRGELARAQQWAEEHDRPILLGEFGAYDEADMASRARWTACVARTAEEYGWSWSYWQFDSDFVVYDIDGGKWVEPIRDALVPAK